MNAFGRILQTLMRLLSGSAASGGATGAPGKADATGASGQPEPEAPADPFAPKPPTTSEAPDEPFPPKPQPPPAPLPLTTRQESANGRRYVVVQGGEREARFRQYKKGLYTVGQQRAADFIEAHRSRLNDLHLSESALRVIFPVSENEGNLDAINTWDNSFLTFGMFQWTIGAKENRGELPALLRKVRDREPEAFQSYFGVYGLDLSSDTGSVYGYLTLDGTVVKADSRKAHFRTPEWAFRFWLAGQDPRVMAIEVEHALSRLKTFYWKQRHEVAGRPIAEVVTSEYGVALILDNHVNRPGYVDNCLRLGVKEAGLQGSDPLSWDTAAEGQLLEAYLRIRETYGKYPMTHAAKRAQRTRNYLEAGRLSAERGSFVYESGVGSRGATRIGIAPADYREEAFPAIEHFDRQIESRGPELLDDTAPDTNENTIS